MVYSWETKQQYITKQMVYGWETKQQYINKQYGLWLRDKATVHNQAMVYGWDTATVHKQAKWFMVERQSSST